MTLTSRKSLGKYTVGACVSQQFPRSLNDTFGTGCFLTPLIEGTITKIVETQNGAFAIVEEDNGQKRLVVLG